MGSSTRKFHHGDRVVINGEKVPAMVRGTWILLDLAPLTQTGYRRGYAGLVETTVRTTVAEHGKGRAWWLQHPETGEVSSRFIARESIMALAEEA